MTNLKEAPTTESSSTPQKTESEHISPSDQTPQSKKKTNLQTRKSASLQTRLIGGILPTVLIPLTIAGAFGWQITRENIETQYRNDLERQALLAGEQINELLAVSLPIPEVLANTPIILEAVREGNQQVITQELNTLTLLELEEQFNQTKLLNPNPTLNNYLRTIVRANGIGEILVTEQNGFNVAYNEIPPDFVQRGEPWWENRKIGTPLLVGDVTYDDTTEGREFPLIQRIEDPTTNEFLGVIRVQIPESFFDKVESTLEHSGIQPTGKVQVLNTSNNQIFITVGNEGAIIGETTQGGTAIETFATAMIDSLDSDESSRQENLAAIATAYNFKNLEITEHIHSETGEEHEEDQNQEKYEERLLNARFLYEGREYKLATVPGTDWVAISSVEQAVIQAAANELIGVFAFVGGILAIVAVGVSVVLARQLANPLRSVSESAQKAAAGDLSARAQPQGSSEMQALADSYNNLVERVQQLLEEQEATAEQQRRQREQLEEEVTQLMNDAEEVADGNLTVRAQLMEGDVGIVADLFNAVIENLQDTVTQVKTSASLVNESLGDNETSMRAVAQGAIEEAEQIQATLKSVAEMTHSIEQVAENAKKAASIADNAFLTVQEGNEAMAQTVESIQGLRSTVGVTAKKMKHLGESAQKISQVVSIIEGISLKTSLLAINASVEANRAGELGQGFTAVAEQVESLAEQSASAAKEIAAIVTEIQAETQAAIETMEQGTTEVVESTRSVEQSQARLTEVVQRSEEINHLMQSISDSTVSQASISQAVSRLMEQMARSSQQRSTTSKQVAEAMQETTQIAKRLEASVEQFKVE